MALRGVWALGLLLGAAMPGVAQAETPFERQVLAELNFARANPFAYSLSLRTFRGWFHAANYMLPGSNQYVATREGTRVVDEAILFLSRQRPVPPVDLTPVLAHSAAILAVDQARSGAIGHAGSDGSSPADRSERSGGGRYVAEVIAYGPPDAANVVRQLIVDDGVADRGHRSIVYSSELRFAGVSCGPHRGYSTMCVIDFSVSQDAQPPIETRFAKVTWGH